MNVHKCLINKRHSIDSIISGFTLVEPLLCYDIKTRKRYLSDLLAHSFIIYSFNMYLLNIFYVPNTFLSVSGKAENITLFLSSLNSCFAKGHVLVFNGCYNKQPNFRDLKKHKFISL